MNPMPLAAKRPTRVRYLVLASLCGWAVKAIDPGVAGAPVVRPQVVAGG